mmetsp:Transcript_17231/g.46998  ORF Transcript_17231/g.46998 Transcript_17231/m.46998 type:complete len:351 (+) Transcript_17231:957-2009(+)
MLVVHSHLLRLGHFRLGLHHARLELPHDRHVRLVVPRHPLALLQKDASCGHLGDGRLLHLEIRLQGPGQPVVNAVSPLGRVTAALGRKLERLGGCDDLPHIRLHLLNLLAGLLHLCGALAPFGVFFEVVKLLRRAVETIREPRKAFHDGVGQLLGKASDLDRLRGNVVARLADGVRGRGRRGLTVGEGRLRLPEWQYLDTLQEGELRFAHFLTGGLYLREHLLAVLQKDLAQDFLAALLRCCLDSVELLLRGSPPFQHFLQSILCETRSSAEMLLYGLRESPQHQLRVRQGLVHVLHCLLCERGTVRELGDLLRPLDLGLGFSQLLTLRREHLLDLREALAGGHAAALLA